jgi:diguanylate cyclase (GGDEF)-like protein
MSQRTDYISSELGKIFTSILKEMAASKTKISAKNIKEKLQQNESFIDLLSGAMAGGDKSDLLKFITPLRGFVAESQLKIVEEMVFNPEDSFHDTMLTLLKTLNEHIISLERRQHKVSSFIEDVFSKFVNLQADLTSSFNSSIGFVEKDLEMDKKLLGDAEDMHQILKTEDSIDYLRSKMLDSFSNFVDTFGTKTESKKGHLDDIAKDYNNVNTELEDYKKQVTKLQSDLQKYKTESVTDHLTGLYNRKYLDLKLEEEIERFKRHGAPFSIVMVDIDHFKNINDTHGHLVGDQVLKHLAGLIRGNIRKTDFGFRYGGEEFLIMLVNADSRNATHVSEQIRKKLETTNFSLKNKEFNVTASFGIAQFKKEEDAESAIKRADDNLYKAKQTGRNKIVG